MYRCNECSMNFKSSMSLSNHRRIHNRIINSNLRNDIISDHVNNQLTYRELHDKYKLSMVTISKFLKGVEIDKSEKNKHNKKFKKHTEDSKKLISEKRIKWLKENPDKHVWKRNDKFKSNPCEYLKNVLRKNNISFVEEYSPLSENNYSIDICFPNIKVGIEINGNQHYNRDNTLKEYYVNRKNKIENEGWKIYDIHYSKIYNSDFIKSLTDKLSIDELKDVDLSFYIKEKKKNTKEKEKIDKIQSIINNILNSDIDFSKLGWVKKVSKIIGIHENKGGFWVKRNMKEFYDEKCLKRKVTYSNIEEYYKSPKYCPYCGEVISFKNKHHKFCSQKCASITNNKLRKKHNRI